MGESNLVQAFGADFERLHNASCELVRLTPAGMLYWQPRQASGDHTVNSCGEHVLRSAGSVEQVFGGITANLWDDPFEWTLPENLSTPDAVISYLEETAATRRRGFGLFAGDADLRKQIATPSGEMEIIGGLLTGTLVRAAHHLGRAFATFRFFSDARLPRI